MHKIFAIFLNYKLPLFYKQYILHHLHDGKNIKVALLILHYSVISSLFP